MNRKNYLALDENQRMAAHLDAMSLVANVPGFEMESAPDSPAE